MRRTSKRRSKRTASPVEGKNIFPRCGEFSANLIRERVLGKGCGNKPAEVPARPPVLCAGCPHRGVFYTLSKLKLNVLGDIGCYTLGAVPPLSAMDAVICMGASIGMAGSGSTKPTPRRISIPSPSSAIPPLSTAASRG